MKNICPYCSGLLAKMPSRKTKCPHCSNYILVRTHPITKLKILVTEQQTKEIDRLRKEISLKNKYLRNLEQYGVTERDYDVQRDRLYKKYGQEPRIPDVVWAVFNELLIAKINDIYSLPMIYFEMALFLNDEGKDPFKILQNSRKMELLRIRQEGGKKVTIISCEDACEQCRRLHGKVFKIEEALRIMPIPSPQCTFILETGKRGWCRCVYAPYSKYISIEG